MGVDDAGVAVAGNGIVAAVALEFVEGADRATDRDPAGGTGVGLAGRHRGSEPACVIDIREIRAPDGLDRDQRVGSGADAGAPGPIGHRPGGKLDIHTDADAGA